MDKTPIGKNNSDRQFSFWLDELNKHEISHLIELVEQGKKWVISAESIPEEKCQQFIDNFTFDLLEFYQQTQSTIKHSLYAHLLKESFWANLASLTDKSQVEWAELQEDFAHEGLYQSGDFIGFGEVECLSCHQVQHIYHLSQLTSCIECNGDSYTRRSLTP